MKPDPAALVADLRAALDDAGVLVPASPGDPQLSRYLTDWRGRYTGSALAITRPATTEEVAHVVKCCAAHGASIVPQGGHTGLVGGGVPDGSGMQVVLSLQRMNKVLGIDRDNLSITVQAGCILADVQRAADDAGLLFPLSMASEGSCTIGGNLATNAGGTQVLRYGTARELCLGLEAVTAQGEVWTHLKGLRKDNTGYDLRDLVIGSEGTLAIITAACLKLYPQPRSRMATLMACDTLADAIRLLNKAREVFDASLTGFEAMQRHPVELALRHEPDQAGAARQLMAAGKASGSGGPTLGVGAEGGVAATGLQEAGLDADDGDDSRSSLPPWSILMDVSSMLAETDLQHALEGFLAEGVAERLVTTACVSSSMAQYRAMWALREAIPLAEKAEGRMVKHDIAVPTSRIPEFVALAEAALSEAFPGCRVVCFGHLGDGNLHYNVQAPEGIDAAGFLAQHEADVNRLVYDVALGLGGTLSAEHGIGQLKREELAQRGSPVGLAWMRAIKKALDPDNVFNPGRTIV